MFVGRFGRTRVGGEEYGKTSRLLSHFYHQNFGKYGCFRESECVENPQKLLVFFEIFNLH